MDYEEILMQIPAIKKWIPTINYFEEIGYHVKSSEYSAHIRNEGNSLLVSKDHNELIHQLNLMLYTRSIVLAPVDSEDQALGYSNRSVLLMHLDKYKNCLVDIDRALKITQSKELKKKLLLRKEKCLVLMNTGNDKNIENLSNLKINTTESFLKEEIDQLIPDKDLNDELKLLKTWTLDQLQENFDKVKNPKIVSPNETNPNFSDSLSLVYDEDRGRVKVMATRDINIGEILAIEKGFVFPRFNNKIYIACSHCLNFTWNGIPCDHCVFAVYCSEQCKVDAWQEYHDIECSILPPLFSGIFRGANMSHEMLAIRLFIRFVKSEGLKNIIDQTKSIDNDKNSHINGFLSNGKFDNTKFKSFYNLTNFQEDEKKKGSEQFGSIATLLLFRYTDIFKNYSSKITVDLVMFVKKLLIKLKTTVNCNSSSFTDVSCECNDVKECRDYCAKNLGCIVTPCCSQSCFNNSCFSNTCVIFCKGARLMLISKRPIKENEEIFINWIPQFRECPREERQNYLKKYFHSVCICEPCKNEWPETKEDLDKEFDPATVSRVKEEMIKFLEEARNKKIDNFTISLLYNWIEVSYKHFNSYEACRFTINHVYELASINHKIYGFYVEIPEKC